MVDKRPFESSWDTFGGNFITFFCRVTAVISNRHGPIPLRLRNLLSELRKPNKQDTCKLEILKCTCWRNGSTHLNLVQNSITYQTINFEILKCTCWRNGSTHLNLVQNFITYQTIKLEILKCTCWLNGSTHLNLVQNSITYQIIKLEILKCTWSRCCGVVSYGR